MRVKLPSLNMSAKLPLIIVAFVTATIAIIAVANATLNTRIIKSAATETLETVALLKAKSVNTLLNTIERDLRLQSDTATTRQAMIALSDGYPSLQAKEQV